MKKLLLLSALLFLRCSVQPAYALTCPSGLIEIHDTAVVNAANGQPYTGSITITQSADSLQGSSSVLGDQQTVTVTAGALDVCVSPGRFASRQRAAGSALTIAGVWVVPSSGGPYRLTDIPAGTVSTAGTAVTSTGGINFAAVAPNDSVAIAGLSYKVCSVQNVTALTLCGAGAPTLSGATFSDGPIQQMSPAPAVTAIYGLPGPSGTGNAPYSRTVTALTTLYVPAATHMQGATPVGFCFDAGIVPTDCKAVPDASGNMTFTWPVAFTGSIRIIGGGTGATGAMGATGAPGPTGPAGTIGVFGSAPSTAGIYCPQVTVTTGPSYAYGWASCSGVLSLLALTNTQLAALANAQLLTMTN